MILLYETSSDQQNTNEKWNLSKTVENIDIGNALLLAPFPPKFKEAINAPAPQYVG